MSVASLQQQYLTYVAEEEQKQKPLPNKENALRVVTFNVHEFRPINGWSSSVEGVKKALQAINADVIFLQETSGRGDVPFSKELKGRVFSCFNGAVNNSIVSRLPLVKKGETLTYKHTVREPRCAVAVHVRFRNTTVTCINTHLDVFDNSGLTRQKQVRELLNWIKENKWKNVVLCGDFNAIWPREYTEEQLKLFKKQDKQRGVEENLNQTMDIVTKEFQETFDVLNETPPVTTTWTNRRIDYVLVSASLKVKRTGVWFTKASDHLPVWADLEPNSSFSSTSSSLLTTIGNNVVDDAQVVRDFVDLTRKREISPEVFDIFEQELEKLDKIDVEKEEQDMKKSMRKWEETFWEKKQNLQRRYRDDTLTNEQKQALKDELKQEKSIYEQQKKSLISTKQSALNKLKSAYNAYKSVTGKNNKWGHRIVQKTIKLSEEEQEELGQEEIQQDDIEKAPYMSEKEYIYTNVKTGKEIEIPYTYAHATGIHVLFDGLLMPPSQTRFLYTYLPEPYPSKALTEWLSKPVPADFPVAAAIEYSRNGANTWGEDMLALAEGQKNVQLSQTNITFVEALLKCPALPLGSYLIQGFSFDGVVNAEKGDVFYNIPAMSTTWNLNVALHFAMKSGKNCFAVHRIIDDDVRALHMYKITDGQDIQKEEYEVTLQPSLYMEVVDVKYVWLEPRNILRPGLQGERFKFKVLFTKIMTPQTFEKLYDFPHKPLQLVIV